MTLATRKQALEAAGLVHPNPEAVSAPLFDGERPFFLAVDKVQVKYEMLRAHVVDGVSVTESATAHGYSRPAFYLVAASFEERGMAGLLDERRGRRGPLKMTSEIEAFIADAGTGRVRSGVGGPDCRRIRRVVAPSDDRTGAPAVRRFWPAGEAAQADYELIREVVLADGASLPVAAQRFERRGLAGLIAWPAAEAAFSARLAGAARPAWTPHTDPRVQALAAGFELLLAAPVSGGLVLKEAR